MKRLLFGSLVALGLAVTALPVEAGWSFDYSVSRHIGFVYTGRNRCFGFSSVSNPLPCAGGCCPSGPTLWGGLAGIAPPAYGYGAYPAPVAAAPATTAPATAPAANTTPFKAPQPAPAANGTNGVQQAGYFYYGQPASTGYGPSTGYNYYGNSYGYGAGYGYGYGYGASYAQVPNYWY